MLELVVDDLGGDLLLALDDELELADHIGEALIASLGADEAGNILDLEGDILLKGREVVDLEFEVLEDL